MIDVKFHQAVQGRLSSLKGLLWDLDNTLYRLDAVVEQAFDLAVARAVAEAGVDLPQDLAVQMARDSYLKYGLSGQVFLDRYGVDPLKLHHEYHRIIDESIITRSNTVIRLFGRLPQTHALVTHGARSWAQRVIARLGLEAFFPDERIFALEDYDFKHKHKHSAGFDLALDKLGLAAHETGVVEDTLANLAIPRRLGMTTIYITHGRQPPTMGDPADISCRSLDDVLGLLTPGISAPAPAPTVA